MPASLTSPKWVERAKSIWGNQYDYSKVVYINAKTPVTVICPIHGEWKCNPDNHVSKHRGCPECGGSKRKTTDAFIKDAKAIHGNTYDYSESKYMNAKKTVQITCPIHGAYWITPDAHTNGKQGCPRCGDSFRGLEQRISDADIQERLMERCEGWDSVVTLEAGTYTGMNSKAATICSKHGRQEPRLVTSLLSSPHPCKKCTSYSKDSYFTTDEICQIIDKKFNGKYRILPFIYRSQQTVLHLLCPIEGHGEWSIQYRSLAKSRGCPKCSYNETLENRKNALKASVAASLQDRFKDWLDKAHKVHGSYYDYSKLDFNTQRKPVVIICPIHGEFTQTPYTHLKSGCRKCADEELFGLYSEGFFERHPEKGSVPAKVYYLKFQFEAETWFKVGITINTIQQRFSVTSKSPVKYEILGEFDTSLEDAWLIETDIQRSHGDFCRYTPKLTGSNFSVRDLRLGPSECFVEPLEDEFFEEVFG